MSARTVLVCNRCNIEGRLTPARDLNVTRLRLRELGWGYWGRGVDYCPACLPIVVEEHKTANPMRYA